MNLLSNTEFYDKYSDTPLNNVQIIGSHDSACYQLMCGNTNNKLVKVLNPLRYIFPCVNNILKDWTLTQKLCVGDQLKLGVRALDLRVTYDEKRKEFFFTHTFYCVPVMEVLQQIREYVDNDPTAFAIILFRPDWEHRQTYTVPINHLFKHVVLSVLGGKTIQKPDDQQHYPTLKTCLDKSQQLIIGFTDDADSGNDFIWDSKYFNGGWVQDLDDEQFYTKVMNFVEYHHNEMRINHIPLVKTPTTDVVKQDIKNRLLNCKYKAQSVKTWSVGAFKVHQRLQQELQPRTNIFWFDFV